MDLPPTSLLVMLLIFCKGDRYGQGDFPSWLAHFDSQTRQAGLWRTLCQAAEPPSHAALRCLKEQLWPEADDVLKPTDFIACGDSLSKEARIRLYCVPWLLPQQFLKFDSALCVPIGPSLPEMDPLTLHAFRHAPSSLRHRMKLLPRDTPGINMPV